MNFRDRGIIISKKNLKECSYIITVFTETHGIYSGVLKQYSRKLGDTLAEGNLIDFFWNARLHEHIGSAKAELIKSFSSHIMSNKIKLYSFNSIVSLLKQSFCEREPHNNLFPTLLEYMNTFKKDFSFIEYIKLELAILAEAGYHLQLNQCAVTNIKKDLYYVSPKSGRAVSKTAGENYANKLLKLPQFLLGTAEMGEHSINDAFKLTSYFFDRYIFLGKPQPPARINLIENLLKNYNA